MKKKRVKAAITAGFVVLMALVASVPQAAEFDLGGDPWGEEEPFLEVDEAFVLSASLNNNGVLQAHWDMPDGYYLYRHQIKFQSRSAELTLGTANIPPGKPKVDEYFGEVEVFYATADAAVALRRAGSGPVEVGIGYQGCAERGLCYPPEWRWFEADGNTLLSLGKGASVVPPAGIAALQNAAAAPVNPPATQQHDSAGATIVSVADSEEQLLAGILADGNLLYALGLFFIAGIGLAFTPCVLPMVPILSSIIVGEGKDISKRRATTLSLAYVLGMAATYAVAGMLVGLFGAELNLQGALQSPPVLVVFALLFVLLSLSMFGFYELQLPQALQARLNSMGQRQQGGKHASVLGMGALSSLVVSPCVSAPLAGALIYISTTNDAVLGGTALLALGLGMGVPLLVVGASGGHWLPRAGAWMNNVKAVFGVLLLAVAVWLLERVVPATVTLALWAALLLASGVYLGVLDSSPRQGFARLAKASGTLAFLWGVLLLVGAASGANDPLKPLARLAATGAADGSPGAAQAPPQWSAVKSLADVQQQVVNSGQPAILDLYADWCISCKIMERNVFPANAVAVRLHQFKLLRADVTDNDPVDRELLNYYGLFGPPSLIFFSPDGRELTEVRLQGEVDADTLAAHLGAILASVNAPAANKIGEIAAISR